MLSSNCKIPTPTWPALLPAPREKTPFVIPLDICFMIVENTRKKNAAFKTH